MEPKFELLREMNKIENVRVMENSKLQKNKILILTLWHVKVIDSP